VRQPIKNLESKLDLSTKTLQLITPWCSIELEIDDEHSDDGIAIQNDIDSKVYTERVSDCLELLADYPISVVKPRLLDFFIEQKLSVPVCRKFSEEMARNEFAPKRKGVEIARWPLDEIYTFSLVEKELFDPASAHSKIIEHFLFADVTANLKIKLINSLNGLLKTNENAFFEVIETILTQTFYLTSNCLDALNPATQWTPEYLEPFCSLIYKFQQQEAGHHHLIKDSILKIGKTDVDPSKTFPETEKLMGLLKYTALSSPLAFCCLLSIFEGQNFNETDPLASIIAASSKPQAARGLQVHHNINLREKHGKIGERASFMLPLVTAGEISDAIVAVDLMTSLVGCQLQRVIDSKADHV
jgi:hypothetical protein